MTLGTLYHGDRCFACGREHPAGLRIAFVWTSDRRVQGRFAFRPEHEGPPGRAHGGLVALALDDAMSMPIHGGGRFALTGRLEVDFRAAAPIGRELVVEAWIDREEGRKLHLRGALRDGETTIATGAALYVAAEPRVGRSGPTGSGASSGEARTDGGGGSAPVDVRRA